MPSIQITEELYRELGQFGNRDESWNDVVARVLEHVDEQAALADKTERKTEYETKSETNSESNKMSGTWSGYSKHGGHDALKQLENGTKVRHQYKRGEDAGTTVEATVRDGHVWYNGAEHSPSKAAREANTDVKGKETRIDGWRWWEYYDEQREEWVELDNIR